jgi:hypothetical protein
MAKKKPDKEYWAEICEPELQIMIFRDEGDIIQFARDNGPVTIGTVTLSKTDERRIRKDFKDHRVVCSAVSWKRYAPTFGYNEDPS